MESKAATVESFRNGACRLYGVVARLLCGTALSRGRCWDIQFIATSPELPENAVGWALLGHWLTKLTRSLRHPNQDIHPVETEI